MKTAAALAGVGKGPMPDGDNTETDRLKREAEQQKLETRVEALRTALATERELEQQQYEQRLADLAEFLAKRAALKAAPSAVDGTGQGGGALAQYGATPWGFAAAAAAAAAGAAQIATIRSTSRGGGGSAAPVSAGGTGAGATTSAPAQAPAGDPGPAQTLYVEGIDPSTLISGELFNDIVDRLLDHQRDGGRVVLAR